MGINPDKIVYAQTVLRSEDILKLKQKTHKGSIKDALQDAVEHYLNCPGQHNDGQK